MNTLFIIRGDSGRFFFSLRDCNGNVVPFEEGDTVYFTVKKNTIDTKKLLQKKVTEFEDGVAPFYFEPKDTKDMEFGDYIYDIQVTSKNGVVKTVIKPSKFVIGGEVTYE